MDSRKNRRSIRLKGYDYRWSGGYFVTICTYNKQCLFGDVVNGKMELNRYGEIVYKEWFRTQKIRPYVVLREWEFVIMPNHIHGIIWIVGDTGKFNLWEKGRTRLAPTGATGMITMGLMSRSLGAILAGFKSSVTKRINQIQEIPEPIWQRNYYERIIRNEQELRKIQKYIATNPITWEFDRENPQNHL